MEDDRLIDCGGMVGGGGGGGGGSIDIQSKETTGITTVLNLWIYHRSLLVNYNCMIRTGYVYFVTT